MLEHIIRDMKRQLQGNRESFYGRELIAVRVYTVSMPMRVLFDGHEYILSDSDTNYAYYERQPRTTMTVMEESCGQ